MGTHKHDDSRPGGSQAKPSLSEQRNPNPQRDSRFIQNFEHEKKFPRYKFFTHAVTGRGEGVEHGRGECNTFGKGDLQLSPSANVVVIMQIDRQPRLWFMHTYLHT